MISKSDIVEAIRVQRERLRKFQSFRLTYCCLYLPW